MDGRGGVAVKDAAGDHTAMILKAAGLVMKVDRQTPIAERPVSWTLRHGLMQRVIWPLVAMGWLMMCAFLARDMLTHGETWGLLMPLVFAAIGGSLFLFSVRALVWRRRETIGRKTIEVDERDSAGHKTWSEPLSAYRGIAVVEVERDAESMFGKMKVVVLDHERGDRRIVLWSHKLSRDVERFRDGYAGWLDLPVVNGLTWLDPMKSPAASIVRRA